ncbi:MAG: DUF4127 family protein [Megamonas funiformis]|uniref:DUF4127 family protein n=1 Tax=Megamonas funiformis TaxID=437897 RepID=UPI002A7FA5BD|nr:DUF4127 family protein [Megamonas funiformis]MDY3875495.1 DUF4127 family protein [Megamonas funiformis]
MKFKSYIKQKWLLSIIAVTLMIVYYLNFIQLPPAVSVELQQNYKYKLILIPLDTRPPCQKMVVDAGKMAGVQIITPPSEIMDYYTKEGDTKKIQKWLMDNIDKSDGVIVSIDQLLHGGLLASRELGTKQDESQILLKFMRDLKTKAKDKPIYAFNVLPRITPPPTLESDSKKMIKISRLIDEISVFENEDDIKLLADLKEDIKQEDLDIYLDLFRRNTALNKELINLAKEGIITKLVIGQDDGEDFGIPNMEKKSLINYVHSLGISNDVVMITKGADEVALSLLANFVQTKTNYQPKVYVEYNDEKAMRTVMPFMAGSVGSTVEEKLVMANAKKVNSPQEAGLILYVFIGNDENMSTQRQSALKIKKYLEQGKKVALVDLSKHFSANEVLFPTLLKEDVPINELTSYAGWNTASNSIGTALANAVIYKAIRPTFNTTNDMLVVEYNRLNINYERFLEDYYYLKEVIDVMNITLKNHGYENVNDLDMEHNYIWMNKLLQSDMQKRANQLNNSEVFKMPFKVQTPEGVFDLTIRNLQVDVFFPWPRTFEVYLDVRLNLYRLNN